MIHEALAHTKNVAAFNESDYSRKTNGGSVAREQYVLKASITYYIDWLFARADAGVSRKLAAI